MTLSEKAKMLAGALYRADDDELRADAARCVRHLAAYNAMTTRPPDERRAYLRGFLGAVGEDVVVRSPFHCDYGFNIFLGPGVFLNFQCVVLDVAPVRIGAGTQIGPNVQIVAADHPRDPAERRAGLEYGRPIEIGANVWIGSGAIVLPGVRVGDDAIVGAGAVVTRDVARGETVVGAPARVRGERE